MKHTLGKEERLKSKKLIEKLYLERNSVKAFPLRMIFLQTEHTSKFPAQVGVSVPKRNFKLAVDRNRIKRLMRESYRLQKEIVYNNIEQPYVFMISYIGKEKCTYEEMYLKMEKLLTRFVSEINTKKNDEI
ncbi:ribonuclease P protein component [Polaribacter sp. Z014]|uniref:ribonuclease P protein component n=1 Tax=unclassified Polaribacter TaxID=196858 RepID=UPI00193B37A7|nr:MULTISPECIES: ribonuclease P protein component [unclassified Polaribacter]MCL7761859.1 ribonuclease P protein component [Polaribacter sp. Z014]QVY64743.1 ribonuclease P protein component [Polaribacter sp. Q13]